MAQPLGCECYQVSQLVQNDSVKNSSMRLTPVTVPHLPRSLAPTVIRCLLSFMEFKLSVEYFLDVVCKSSFQFLRDRCQVSPLALVFLLC